MSILEKEIFDINNYNKELNLSINEILINYIELTHIYILYIINNLDIKDKDILIYITNYGLKTISNIFLLLLLYTKNINLSIKYSKKSFCYYSEFITQIFDEKNIYTLICEAIKFVYKKTIYNLNNNFIKNEFILTSNEREKYNNIKIFSLNHINILSKLFKKSILEKDDSQYDLLKNNILKNNKILLFILEKNNMNQLIKIYNIMINNNIKFNIINKLINILINENKENIFLNSFSNINFIDEIKNLKTNKSIYNFINQL